MKNFGKIIELSRGNTLIQVAPEMGFALVKLVWNGMNMLDMSRESEFIRVRKGLGPLILPHFNQDGVIPDINNIDYSLFPHIRELSSMGIAHPFQHGTGRYVSWDYNLGEFSIVGKLNTEMWYKGFKIKELTGYSFNAEVSYYVYEDSIELKFNLKGNNPIAAGIHFYYDIIDKTKAQVILPKGVESALKVLPLDNQIDKVFPVKKNVKAQEIECILKTSKYKLNTTFLVASSPEFSFDSVVIFSPKDAHFACIEPISYRIGDKNEKKEFLGSIKLSFFKLDNNLIKGM